MEQIIPYNVNKTSINRLIQWDKGVYVYFYDVKFTKQQTIHLYTNSMNEAMVIETILDSNGVLSAKLPDDLLCLGDCIYGYICEYANEEFRSMYRFTIPVTKKPKPSNYIHTESKEYVTIEEKIKEMNDIAQNVSTMSDETKSYLDQTKISEENASNYAQDSLDNANQSLEYANQSKGYMEQSLEYSNTAKIHSDTSKEYADNSLSSANDSLQYANQAKGYMDSTQENIDKIMENVSTTEQYMQDISGYIENAKTSADNASVSEQNAKISEQNAKQSEDNTKVIETKVDDYQTTLIELIKEYTGETPITNDDIDNMLSNLE